MIYSSILYYSMIYHTFQPRKQIDAELEMLSQPIGSLTQELAHAMGTDQASVPDRSGEDHQKHVPGPQN